MATKTIGISRNPRTRNFYTYKDIENGGNGWIDPVIFLPRPFDLLWLKTLDFPKQGWWTGTSWDGIRITKDIQVIFWKRKPGAV